jgi:hypothetical protein
MDMRADDAADSGEGARWLTHAEIAAIRGISTASAIKLALRRGWRKQKDNRGVLRCLVPPKFISLGSEVRADTRVDTRAPSRAEGGAELSTAIVALQTAVTSLGDQLSQERMRADRAEAEREDLRTKLTDAQVQLAVAKASADQMQTVTQETEERAEVLRRELDRAQIAQVQAAATIDELRAEQATAIETHARELAVAQHDAVAAQEAAAKAEQGKNAERERADAINTLLGTTQEELAGQRALTDAARQDAQTVQEWAAGLRQAEAERKARGRLRRAWAAWRGR